MKVSPQTVFSVEGVISLQGSAEGGKMSDNVSAFRVLYEFVPLQNQWTVSADFVSMVALWGLNQYRKRSVSSFYRSLLPCYSSLFSTLMAATGVQAVVVYLTWLTPLESFTISTTVIYIMERIKHVILDGWMLLMHKPGVGRKTLKDVSKVCVPYLVLMIIVMCVLAVFQYDLIFWYVFLCLRSVVYTLVFASTFFSSRVPAFRRRTLRIFAVTMALEGTYMSVALNPQTLQLFRADPAHNWLYSFICTARNVVVYWAMTRDTRYWLNDLNDHEMEQVNKEVGKNVSDIRRPLLGLSLEDGAGRVIGRQFDHFKPRDVIGHAELSLNMSQLIGHGGVSRVFSGVCRGEAVAIKLLFVPEISRSTVNTFFHEAAFLRSLSSHPNMVQLRGICVAPPALCHVLELCDGNVHSLITERRRKLGAGLGRSGGCDKVFLSLGLQCARAVAFLHSREPPIIHRDIKSMNFLFIRQQSSMHQSGFVVKLTDMDLALSHDDNGDELRAVSSLSSRPSESASGFCGTPQWASPEIFRGESFGDVKSDVYSLLVVLWELLTLEMPYEGIDRRELGELIGKKGSRLPIPKGIPNELTQLFEAGWSENPNDRPSADTIVSVLTSLSKDDKIRERETLLNLGLLMFDPKHVTLRDFHDRSGRKVWKCATGGDLMKYLMSSEDAQRYLLKTQEPVEAAKTLCQTLLDKGLIQEVSEKSIGTMMGSMKPKSLNTMKFMSTTMYSLNVVGEMHTLTDVAQSFYITRSKRRQ